MNIETMDGILSQIFRKPETQTRPVAKCACAQHQDGSVTTFLCPIHADIDPCRTKALITGKRRRGSIDNGRCSHCGWEVTR